LQEKVSVLERVVTGREQLEHLTELLLAHDKRVDAFVLQQGQHEKNATTWSEDLKGLLVANKRLLHEVLEEMRK
jgi:hypothetical protein